MLKLAAMSKGTSESMNIYKFLCQKIGSEEVVKIRRLIFAINDIGKRCQFITSGSKGEGLDFKGSDLDIMHVDTSFKVYQSENDVDYEGTEFPLIMNTEETQPCFAQLYVFRYVHELLLWKYYDPKILNLMQKKNLGYVLSSELYKLGYLSLKELPALHKVHGPCISDHNETHDDAWCLKCDTWIFQAKPWVSRPRKTWPPSELISRIISYGVLFVPVGCKGSRNENLEWRISFSVAEKNLIFSFSHTQVLCYAMLKIFLKEIIEKHEDMKGLLCSYFLKTLMFWILEETYPHLWRPDNFIPCFMACLQRLVYSVRYSILSHYFIPDNNLFHLRFNTYYKQKLTNILVNLYLQGTNCFATADTFHDYQIQSYEINESLLCRPIRCLHHILPTFSTICMHHYSCKVDRFSKLLFNFLHHSNTGLSRRLFALQLSAAFMLAIESTQYVHSAGNKYRYVMYKHDLSNLMIGLHSDAVSGLLKLASFFYVHRNYTDALTVLTHTLQKCTNEKFYTAFFDYTDTFTHFQNHAVDMLKNEKICTIIKLLTIHAFRFGKSSSIVPQELQLEVPQELQLHLSHSFHPLPFAHFLCFLCYYHLLDITSCIQCIQQLEHVRLTLYDYSIYHPNSQETHILCGIAYQMMGETHLAFNAFQNALEIYVNNLTSAASRLSSLF